MPKLGGPAATSVVKGFEEDRFARLPERDQRDLLKLMARIAEKAYRRGMQQGAEGGEMRGNLHAWRYGPTLDRSPAADIPGSMKSLVRLQMECGDDLRRLGLRINVDDWDQQPCWAGVTPAQRDAWLGPEEVL